MLGRGLVERYEVRAWTRQTFGLRAVVLCEHVVLVVQPVPVLDGRLIGRHHPNILVGREILQVIGYGDAFRPLVLCSPLSSQSVVQEVQSR